MFLKMARKLFFTNGLTFTELLAASIITGVVMVGVASMDISLRNAFEGTSKGSIVTSRASVAMHNISRHILEAAGSSSSPGATAAISPGRLWIRKDSNLTPSNYSDDTWYIYQHDPINFTLRYCTTSNSSSSCVTELQKFNNIVGFEPTLQNNSSTNVFSVKIKITGRFDASQPADPMQNPESIITSVFSLPSLSSTIP